MPLPPETVYTVQRIAAGEEGDSRGWRVVGPGIWGARGHIPNKRGTMTEGHAKLLAEVLEVAYTAGRLDQLRDIQKALGISDFLDAVRNLSERMDDPC